MTTTKEINTPCVAGSPTPTAGGTHSSLQSWGVRRGQLEETCLKFLLATRLWWAHPVRKDKSSELLLGCLGKPVAEGQQVPAVSYQVRFGIPFGLKRYHLETCPPPSSSCARSLVVMRSFPLRSRLLRYCSHSRFSYVLKLTFFS